MSAKVTIDRRLWLTADRERVVEDGDAAAAFLYATPGQEVPSEEAERYGLIAEPKPEPKPKARGKTKDKAAPAPANKASGGDEDDG